MWVLCRDRAGKLHIVLPKTRKSTVKLECDQVRRRAIRFINNYSCVPAKITPFIHPQRVPTLLRVPPTPPCFLPRFISSPPSVTLYAFMPRRDVPRLHSVLCVCGTLPAFYALLRAN